MMVSRFHPGIRWTGLKMKSSGGRGLWRRNATAIPCSATVGMVDRGIAVLWALGRHLGWLGLGRQRIGGGSAGRGASAVGRNPVIASQAFTTRFNRSGVSQVVRSRGRAARTRYRG